MDVDEHSQAGNLGSNSFFLQKLCFSESCWSQHCSVSPKLKSLGLSDTKFKQDTLLAILKDCKQLESMVVTGVGILGMELEVQKLVKSVTGNLKWDSHWQLICEAVLKEAALYWPCCCPDCGSKGCLGSCMNGCPECGDQDCENYVCLKRSLSSDGESDN